MSQNSKIEVEEDKTLTVEEVFKLIMNQTDYNFFFEKGIFKDFPKVQIKKGIIKTNKLLKRSLSQGNLDIEVEEDNIIIIKEKSLTIIKEKQQFQVSGTITDQSGQPLPGANIVEKGTANGTQSDFDGKFSLTVADENAVLIVTYLGYSTKEVNIDGQTSVTIKLTEDATSLDQVIVVGYGTQDKGKLTGAISQVTAADFEKQPVFQIDQAIQGRAAGVVVSQNSGAPGRGSRIRIRGASSITGSNEPLYVVDGVIGVDIAALNPNDIANISVLKDAATLAIYGNLGSNGVVVVTTKKGVSGKSTFSFDTFTSFSSIINTLDIVNGSEFSEIVTRNGGTPGGTANTDWQDALYRNAVLQNYNLSASGGTDKLNFYISGNYVDQEGILINTGYKRYGLRANLNAHLSDKLKMRFNVNGSREETHNDNQGGLGEGIFRTLALMDSNAPLDFEGVTGNNQRGNILDQAQQVDDNRFINTLQGNLAFDWKFAENLTLSVSGGIILKGERRNTWIPALGNQGSVSNRAERGNEDRVVWQNTNKLAYNNTFGDHNLGVELFYEQRKTIQDFTVIQASGFVTFAGGPDNLAVAENYVVNSGRSDFRELNSYFGRATYSYADKYLFTGVLRVDQTSVFPNNQTGVFPGIGLGWNIINESFMENQSTFDQIKLRVGWGQTGNQGVPPFVTTASLNTNSGGYNFGGGNNGADDFSNGIAPPSRLANPDLKWETTTQTNIGLDLSLLDNRLSFTFDYYNRMVEDLLLDAPLASFTGTNLQLRNVGKVENKGFEIGIEASPIKNDTGFNWYTAFNLSANKNEVTELFGDTDFILFGDRFRNSNSSRVEVGQPIGVFNGSIYEGVDIATGEPIYTDADGDGSPDLLAIGDSNPDFTFGFNNTFSYGNFDLNIFINGSQGNDVLNAVRAFQSRGDAWLAFGTHPDILNAWTAANPSTTFPNQSSGAIRAFSTQFIEDGSFIRLKNISLGYNFPDELIKSIGFQKARFYISGQNLITITDYSGLDPELSGVRGSTNNTNGAGGGTFSPGVGSNDNAQGVDWGVYPISKSFIIGLNITF